MCATSWAVRVECEICDSLRERLCALQLWSARRRAAERHRQSFDIDQSRDSRECSCPSSHRAIPDTRSTITRRAFRAHSFSPWPSASHSASLLLMFYSVWCPGRRWIFWEQTTSTHYLLTTTSMDTKAMRTSTRPSQTLPDLVYQFPSILMTRNIIEVCTPPVRALFRKPRI